GLLGLLLLAIMLSSLLRTCQATLKSSPPTPPPAPPPPVPAAPASPQSSPRPKPTPTPLEVPIAPHGSGELILEDARRQIRPIRASEVVNAIERARQIPPGDPQYREAQRQIDQWSQDIYLIARQRANNGDFKGAIAAAQLVPDDRKALYQEAQKAIAQWKKRLP
ncbi:MAG: hypothetical protein VKJ24_19875, partial [Synechococcales bacterium]|nr:hypothetical protein [Synechococcales bacterium]